MIIYIGQFIDRRILELRGLRSPNAATSRRMSSIAAALGSHGSRIVVISPASSLRLARPTRRYHSVCATRRANSVVLYASHLGWSYLSTGWEMLSLPFLVAAVAIRYASSAEFLISYVYYPSNVISILVYKQCIGQPVVLQLEDVSVPKWRDWLRGSETSPVQQLVGYVLMLAAVKLCSFVIVPAKSLADHLENTPSLIIGGCVTRETYQRVNGSTTILVLYSGIIEFEHGIAHIVDAAKILKKNNCSKYKIIVTGDGGKAEWLKNEIRNLDRSVIEYLGFLDESEFDSIMKEACVCLVLQDPEGRHSRFKTPSKVYEQFALGKVVISTRVGNIEELPDDCYVMLRNYSGAGIVDALEALSPEKMRTVSANAYRYATRNWSRAVVGAKIFLAMQSYLKFQNGIVL